MLKYKDKSCPALFTVSLPGAGDVGGFLVGITLPVYGMVGIVVNL